MARFGAQCATTVWTLNDRGGSVALFDADARFPKRVRWRIVPAAIPGPPGVAVSVSAWRGGAPVSVREARRAHRPGPGQAAVPDLPVRPAAKRRAPQRSRPLRRTRRP